MTTATQQPATERQAPPCTHCGLDVPLALVEEGAEHQFCCEGCRGAYQVIHACGLEEYYRVREALASDLQPAARTSRRFTEFDLASFAEANVRPLGDGLVCVDFRLGGVHCAACVWLVEKLPRVVPGVIETRLSLRKQIVRVVYQPEQVALSKIATALDSLGYTPYPVRGEEHSAARIAADRRNLVHLAVAAACAGNTMLISAALYAGWFGGIAPQYETLFAWSGMFIGLIALAWPGAVFFRGAYAALRTRTPHLDLPIALALAIGGLAGTYNTFAGRGEAYFDSLAVLVFLLLVGRTVQTRQQRRAEEAVELLYSLTPATCRVVTPGGEIVETPVESLEPDQVVQVRPGDVVTADGEVLEGASTLNQAMLTGESDPVPVREGDAVFAGTQNEASPLRIRVAAVGQATRAGRLMSVVEESLRDKPPLVQFADRIGGWFVVIVALLASGVLVGWSFVDVGLAIDHAVALLIVACPCALGLATPLTFSVSLGRAAKRGVLIKSAAALDRLARRGRVLLDKTGTLTAGRMELVRWVGDETLRGPVAALERHSQHPAAKALVRSGEDAQTLEHFEDITESPGGIAAQWRGEQLRAGSVDYMQKHGLELSGTFAAAVQQAEAKRETPVLISLGENIVALAALGDRIHADAENAVSQMHGMGWHLSVMSGDRPAVTERVAAEVGIPAASAQGGVLPEGKLAAVKAARGGETLVMVGDGVNDAAALAAADVGIAVHGGAEVSLAAADIYVARPGVAAVAEVFALARHTRRVVRQNLCVSLTYNIAAVLLAAAGFMNPLFAAILMPISSATVLGLAVSRRPKGLSR